MSNYGCAYNHQLHHAIITYDQLEMCSGTETLRMPPFSFSSNYSYFAALGVFLGVSLWVLGL